jgi:hypothetical protein
VQAGAGVFSSEQEGSAITVLLHSPYPEKPPNRAKAGWTSVTVQININMCAAFFMHLKDNKLC